MPIVILFNLYALMGTPLLFYFVALNIVIVYVLVFVFARTIIIIIIKVDRIRTGCSAISQKLKKTFSNETFQV